MAVVLICSQGAVGWIHCQLCRLGAVEAGGESPSTCRYITNCGRLDLDWTLSVEILLNSFGINLLIHVLKPLTCLSCNTLSNQHLYLKDSMSLSWRAGRRASCYKKWWSDYENCLICSTSKRFLSQLIIKLFLCWVPNKAYWQAKEIIRTLNYNWCKIPVLR